MNLLYLTLAERIRGEIPELERVIHKALTSWTKAQEIPEESAYLDSVALNLHGFYAGLERLFELIARRIDGALPGGETWHRDLLQRMTQDIAEIRPAVLSENTAFALDEFRRFRHLVRNVYSLSLVPERIAGLMSILPQLWFTLRAELLAFSDFLEALAQVTQEGNGLLDGN